MKTVMIMITSLFILAACKKDSNPIQQQNDPVLSINQTIDSVSFTLAVPTSTFGVSDTLKASYTLVNLSHLTRTYSFGYAEQIQWSLRRDTNHIIMFQPKVLSPMVTQFVLNPGEAKSYAIQQAIRDDAGAAVIPGVYSLYATLRSVNSAQLTLSVTLR